MKPTPQMVEQYCAALMAWSQGKRVELRFSEAQGWTYVDPTFQFPRVEADLQLRIIDEPPKAREWYLSEIDLRKNPHGKNVGRHQTIDVYERTIEFNKDGNSIYVHVREVTPAAEAEIAELRRNHDAMKTAIREFIEIYVVHGGYLANQLDEHAVQL